MIRELTAIVSSQLGFESFMDIVKSSIAWKHKITTVYVLAAAIGGVFSAIGKFTDSYIYSPALGMYILWITSLIDIIFGISNSVAKKQGISANKISRAMIRVTFQTVLVGIVFQMSHAWGYLITFWMVDSLLIVFTLTILWSVIQNAEALGFITKDQYDVIESIINIKRLFSRIKKKE